MINKKRVLLSFFIIVFIFLSYCYLLPTDKEKQEYFLLMQQMSTAPLKSKKSTPFVAMHQKIGVCKDIFYMEKEQLLHMQIKSDRGDITFEHDGEGVDIVEKLAHVNCLMQEELYYLLDDGQEIIQDSLGNYFFRNGEPCSCISSLQPMQLVRSICAENASYFITKQMLVANQAEVVRYCLKGHDLSSHIDEKVLMQGTADQVSLRFNGKGLQFSAKGLKGQVSFNLEGDRH